MPLTEEEIRIKLGLDTQELDSGTRNALAKIASFGKESHNHFLHADSAAKGFKKTMHELTEQAPVLGYALRAAISPVGAAFALAAAGIGYATKSLEEFNKKLDETAAKNARPISTPTDKWSSFFKVRETLSGKSSSGSGSSPSPSLDPVKIEASERLGEAKRKADELVKAREQELADAESAYRGHETPSRGFAGDLIRVLAPDVTTTGEDKADRESDQLYRNKLEAQRKLKEARDKASMIAGIHSEASKDLSASSPSSGGLNLWNALGLNFSVGTTSRAALQMKAVLDAPRIDPNTGGIAYRPLQYNGVDYHPLKGAPGYVPPTVSQPSGGTSDPLMRIAAGLGDWILNGVPVYGSDKAG